MISPGSGGDPIHNVLIGLTDRDAEAYDYAARGILYRQTDATTDALYSSGIVDTVTKLGNNKLRLTLASSSVINSTPDGTQTVIELGNLIEVAIRESGLIADTAEEKRALRETLAAAQISAGITLPNLEDVNPGDVRLMSQNVASGLSFVDITNPSVTLTSAEATDIMVVVMFRTKTWTRMGNIHAGLEVRERVSKLEDQVWPGSVFVVPHEILASPIVATDITVIPRVNAETYPSGARMRIVAGGVTGAFSTLSNNQERTLSLTQAQMTNAITGGASRGWINGSVTIHPSDSSTVLETIHFQIPITRVRHQGALAYSAAVSMDADRFDVGDLTLTGNTTFSITNGQNGDSVMLRVLQGTTGNHTVTLNSAISTGGRTAPEIASATGKRSYLAFTKVGTAWIYLGVVNDE